MSVTLEPPIAIALDTPDLDAALHIVDALEGLVPIFKIGLELFSAAGPQAVREVLNRGADVFLDLKISDIPNTAAGAVRAVSKLGAAFVTVHANAGRPTVRAAVEAATGSLRILVVSVLTSLDDGELDDIGVGRSVKDQVAAMAKLAAEEGAPGLVLASGEVAAVRRRSPDLFLVTPGIRPSTAAVGDQRRVGTPGAAISAGSDLLVLGRAVTATNEPRAALEAVVDEIDEARGRTVRAGT
ncbi:MAG TPA: orotidine-5'-phosphate decarboxylase [Actinomycetota bacterium]|jgi:orotidine-5'-phosphate decarboxylase|nr:orotidine-5'-phosphate decarboxylase [Actinomycetota bacterium]